MKSGVQLYLFYAALSGVAIWAVSLVYSIRRLNFIVNILLILISVLLNLVVIYFKFTDLCNYLSLESLVLIWQAYYPGICRRLVIYLADLFVFLYTFVGCFNNYRAIINLTIAVDSLQIAISFTEKFWRRWISSQQNTYKMLHITFSKLISSL